MSISVSCPSRAMRRLAWKLRNRWARRDEPSSRELSTTAFSLPGGEDIGLLIPRCRMGTSTVRRGVCRAPRCGRRGRRAFKSGWSGNSRVGTRVARADVSGECARPARQGLQERHARRSRPGSFHRGQQGRFQNPGRRAHGLPELRCDGRLDWVYVRHGQRKVASASRRFLSCRRRRSTTSPPAVATSIDRTRTRLTAAYRFVSSSDVRRPSRRICSRHHAGLTLQHPGLPGASVRGLEWNELGADGGREKSFLRRYRETPRYLTRLP